MGDWDDPRALWMEEYVLKTTKSKPDKWKKLASDEERRTQVIEFWEKKEIKQLVFVWDVKSQLEPLYEFPTSLKVKGVYFIKPKEDMVITKENIKTLIKGDVAPSRVDALANLMDGFFLPMLGNESNTSLWPNVVCTDIAGHAESVQGQASVVSGQMKGKTHLPLPHGTSNLEGDTDITEGIAGSDELLYQLESAVVNWSHQVNEVLKHDSAQPLIDGQHVGPLIELDFWKAKKDNLGYIREQLENKSLSTIATLLEKTGSSYAPVMQKITSDVESNYIECDDICMYLEPIRPLFEEVEEMEFGLLSKAFGQIMHCLTLVWANSTYYQSARRIVVLLRELMNIFIDAILGHIEPRTLFMLEPLEAQPKIAEALALIATIEEMYEATRVTVATKKDGAEKEPQPWSFQNELVLGRMRKYRTRLVELQAMVNVRVDFEKLEKIELSDPVQSKQILSIFEEYNVFYGEWAKHTAEEGEDVYDPVDPEVERWNVDFAKFTDMVTDFDLRISSIATLAFANKISLEGRFKLIHGFQGLLSHRKVLVDELKVEYPQMLELFSTELDEVKLFYDQQLAEPSLAKNMPHVAGMLDLLQQIRARLKTSYDDFHNLAGDIAIFGSEEAELVYQKYVEMLALMEVKDKEYFAEWAETVGEKSDVNLNLPLLKRDDETRLISINFDPQLVSVLREVKYLETKANDDAGTLPESATAIFARNEIFRQYLGNLGIAVTEYNRIQSTVLDVEAPLIVRELASIDEDIEKAIDGLNWNSDGVGEYANKLAAEIDSLSKRLQGAKANATKMSERLASWCEHPMIERDEKSGLLTHSERAKKLSKFYAEVQAGGADFYNLLRENAKLFLADPKSQIWETYVDYLDGLLLDGLFNVAFKSMCYLLDRMDEDAVQELDGPAIRPLFQGVLELQVPHAVCVPGILETDEGKAPMLLDWIRDYISDFYHIGMLVPRLARHSGKPNYRADLEATPELVDLKDELEYKVQSVSNGIVKNYEEGPGKYAHMWTDDRDDFLRQFLLYNHVLTPEEIETWKEDNPDLPFPETPPTLEQYKDNIDKFNALAEEVNSIEDTHVFDKWYKIDNRRFRAALHTVVAKWGYMFIQELSDSLSSTVTELGGFIASSAERLNQPIPEDDYDGLVAIMKALGDLKHREEATDAVFEPLQQRVALLQSFNVEIPDGVLKSLDSLPDQWISIKKTCSRVSADVAPAQADEVTKIKRKANQFDVRNFEFREDFNKRAPTRFDSTDVYNRLDAHFVEYTAMAVEMDDLDAKSDLFVVRLPEYKQLRQCRRELGLLKVLWDTISMVKFQFDDWARTPWSEVDVENMEMECKKLIKEIRQLDKDTRAWEAFNGVDAEVKNMVTSLGAVGLLQSSAIRARHWQQVMKATGVDIEMGENTVADSTTLADLLSLHLHEYEEEVATIVDRAGKELQMEKMLGELEKTWADFNFEYGTHKRRGLPQIKPAEEMIEVLEDNQVQLQNLLASKFIAFFADGVGSWSKKLSTTDQVIEIWGEVQRTWSNLESIFIGSEDIRAQLPEDAKRFDGIDKDYQEVATRSAKITNVVEVTNQPNLFEQFESMQERLALCEKALQEYLDTKRLAFPRFYFVSSADLLDILSNGNNPIAVAKQLSKLFAVICNLTFDEGTKNANGMISLDGEEVKFRDDKGFNTCLCEGRVEIWLMDVLIAMQETLRWQCKDAFVAYEEKPRSDWVFDNAAQVTLVGTQVWWATEVNIAFAKLEEGYENALKDYIKKHIGFLNELITLLQGTLTKQHRVMLQTTCTVDVHSRDVCIGMVAQKAENAEAFLWQSQLRHRWDDNDNHTHINICDAKFIYACEYLGNGPRLVITPLTDRCYITLTQALHLRMGGAPAGPAGTGKTETTKDLSRNIGIMIYVFNCSEQMDYKSTGNIFKGLAQAGSWGCFDEFNRISIEVLSVVAVQVKTVQDAIKAEKLRFNFLGEEISLDARVGSWITMNPGYAGRTALPENIKALFRPCAMVVPDYGMICEIMLVSEGFLSAKLLGRKFITLYSLNRDLLSKQDHYDWGLRAIKSVLVVAGKLKRADPTKSEEEVLMRALRDFNIPKIVNEDLPVFMGLIVDLFPGLDVPRKADVEFEKQIVEAITLRKLQPEEAFVLKVVQLEELLEVRHSVFIIGLAATGKSCVLKALFDVYKIQGQKPVWIDLNPKACTNHELYGYINLSTRDWVDGLFSSLMRDMSNIETKHNKWIVLDGDIDTMWIESLNTVMDDNKILTLASNERIPLNPTMRLLFEIGNLAYASPATVSRAGILFINPTDLGWNPCVQTWIDQLESPGQRANLMILFEKYLPPCLDAMKQRFKTITPIPEWTLVNTLCTMLGLMLTEETTPEGCSKEDYELYFAWCCVWAFGGALFKDQLVDWREEFSKWWITEFKTVRFPPQGNVFDYWIRAADKKFVSWSERVPDFEYDSEKPVSSAMVHTAETTRVKFWMDKLIELGKPTLFVGAPGTGKTATVLDTLNNLDRDNWLLCKTSFNNYTIHHTIQEVLEEPLEKKAGRNYGPPGTKRLVYFVDDLNMPAVDLYGTQAAHTIMRQVCDYNHWYDRVKKSLRVVSKTQFMAAMNPKAGSFTINPRLLRHFVVFAMSAPAEEALTTIYSKIFAGHIKAEDFPNAVKKIQEKIVEAAVKVHVKVASNFLPTAIKFHYLFNLRDLTNVFQGLAFATAGVFKTPLLMTRLLMHETIRVYADKMTEMADIDSFKNFRDAVVKETFPDLEWEKVSEEPYIHCHFADGVGEPLYKGIKSWDDLHNTMSEALMNYNEVNAVMNLVLFRDAMSHVCRINRILENPRGNAMLVGVGGSGKQSLARLSASISGLDTFQIALTKGYGVNELKVDLAACFVKAGVKGQGVMFLMTDSQVADEKFLVLINDLLSTGEITGLFQEDEKNECIDGVRNEVKGAGLEDTNDNCWAFFIERVRRLLKVVLCFSPVGDMLRGRARMFPSLVNCTSIDWFHDWPEDALISVARNFLEDNELAPNEHKDSMAEFMAYVHGSVNEMSQIYLASEKRYNYTTPKSFLEQISLYTSLLEQQSGKIQHAMDRMENGLTKLNATAAQVDDMKEKLAAQEIELKVKNDAANALIETVGIETEKVNIEKAAAAIEQEKVAVINTEVSAKAKSCSEDLAKAEPALEAAEAALNTLNKTNLTELKSFGSPPEICVTVVAAVMCLMAKGKVPKEKNRTWKEGKMIMGNVGQFLDDLVNYDKENIPAENLKETKKYLVNPDFNGDFVAGKSNAAAGLCNWVVNIVMFYEVFCDVAPKRAALAEAESQLKAAQDKLSKVMAQIAKLDAALKKLTDAFQEATDEKLACQAEADKTAKVIGLANRLVGGLASENVRWGEAVALYKKQMITVPGDCLLTTAFLSYSGCFSKQYREIMYNDKWLPYMTKMSKPIPITEDMDPLDMLTDPALIAGWQNELLPSDRVSTENAAILTNAKRWPLIIDPQEQGIKWIKEREKDDIVVLRLGQKGFIDSLERGISNGSCVLLENIFEDVDAMLGDVIGRNTIKKGRAIMIGDKEVEYNPKFRLVLHTKMGNPHYKPEMQAQTTLINFTVTQAGLEDQLLADVVASERGDLQALKQKLTREQNEYMITLKELEDNLLAALSSAEGNFLEDEALVVGLEQTKATAAEIAEKVAIAQTTEVEINTAREKYRPSAARGALLYFIVNVLEKLHPMYQVSLKAFNVVFMFAVVNAPQPEDKEDVAARVANIIDTVTYGVYNYTSRGLFERDKLIFASQMTIAVLALRGEIDQTELSFLLRCPGLPSPSPVDFLTAALWGNIKALSAMEQFANFDRDIEGSAKRWQKFCEAEVPEREKFPGDWKSKTALQQLCMLRCLRPDRMMNAMSLFIGEQLGEKYTGGVAAAFKESYKETTRATGVFFILSPGVNPIAQVEELGKEMGFTFDNGKYHMVSLGQGQEPIAEAAMKKGAEEGHWVVLENIHLVVKWLKVLEKTMEDCAAMAHPDFRFYLTAEPAGSPEYHIMPQGILQACIKITNEPPSGVQANLHAALNCFSQDTLEMCAREVEFKKILFALVYHHAVILERRKFGPIGWNVNYPFNKGDLMISSNVLFNYLEANSTVPWIDLRYLFGEIMYGGHITDNIDRRLESTYLMEYLKPEMLDADIDLAPGFQSPPPSDFVEYHTYIDEAMPPESPYLYGLHPNAEIDYLTLTSARLFNEVLAMQSTAGSAASGGASKEELVGATLEEFVEKIPETFNMFEMAARVPPEERTPYINVAFQEASRMNRLLAAILNGLKEVRLGLKGELTVTPAMEAIENALFFDTVPPHWGVILGPSTKPLGAWFTDVLERVKFLEAWIGDFALPSTVWLGGLFNPQAFLTAISQQTARKNEWPLDKVVLTVDVTKKYNAGDFSSPPREGAYLYGLYMAGARWDTQTGLIQDARLKELCPPMPVIFCKAIPVDKEDLRGTYSCPTFKTVERGRAKEAVAVGLCPGFVWYFNLKTKAHPNKWTLAGCAMTLSD
jgi:dynein heavy chain